MSGPSSAKTMKCWMSGILRFPLCARVLDDNVFPITDETPSFWWLLSSRQRPLAFREHHPQQNDRVASGCPEDTTPNYMGKKRLEEAPSDVKAGTASLFRSPVRLKIPA
jgi:hypothetical protein